MRLYTQCLSLLMKPIVRFCLRRSIKVQDVIETAKIVFVELAEEEIRKSGKDISASKISVMTGMHRRDISRLYQSSTTKKQAPSLIARLIGQWQHDRRFSTKAGRPRVLSYEGADSEFAALVRSVSKELNSYTLLFELERIGAIEKTTGGIRLLAGSFVPRGDLKEGIDLLSKDMEDLMSAVEENVSELSDVPHLHLKTEYDNVPETLTPLIREWLLKEGSSFHQRARDFISGFDRDINPDVEDDGTRIRVAVGTFSRVQKLS